MQSNSNKPFTGETRPTGKQGRKDKYLTGDRRCMASRQLWLWSPQPKVNVDIADECRPAPRSLPTTQHLCGKSAMGSSWAEPTAAIWSILMASGKHSDGPLPRTPTGCRCPLLLGCGLAPRHLSPCPASRTVRPPKRSGGLSPHFITGKKPTPAKAQGPSPAHRECQGH